MAAAALLPVAESGGSVSLYFTRWGDGRTARRTTSFPHNDGLVGRVVRLHRASGVDCISEDPYRGHLLERAVPCQWCSEPPALGSKSPRASIPTRGAGGPPALPVSTVVPPPKCNMICGFPGGGPAGCRAAG